MSVCKGCGAEKRIQARGLCGACVSRERRQDPERAAKDRAASLRWKQENREANRARDRAFSADPERRGRCVVCNDLMGRHVFADGVCADCRSELHEARWHRIERMWADGMSVKGIAAELGITKGTLAGEMAAMREAGRDVPYRYRNTKLQRMAA